MGLNEVAEATVLGLGGCGRGGVVEAAARHLEAGTDLTGAITGGLAENVDDDAEFFGDLRNRLASAQKLNGLRFELGSVSFALD